MDKSPISVSVINARPNPVVGKLIYHLNSNQYVLISKDLQSGNHILELSAAQSHFPDSWKFEFWGNPKAPNIISVAPNYWPNGLFVSDDFMTNPIIELGSNPDQFEIISVTTSFDYPSSSDPAYLITLVQIINNETGLFLTYDRKSTESSLKLCDPSEKFANSLFMKIQEKGKPYFYIMGPNIINTYYGYGLTVKNNIPLMSYMVGDTFELEGNVMQKLKDLISSSYLYVAQNGNEYELRAKQDVTGENCHFTIKQLENTYLIRSVTKNAYLKSSQDISPEGNQILEALDTNVFSPDFLFMFEDSE